MKPTIRRAATIAAVLGIWVFGACAGCGDSSPEDGFKTGLTVLDTDNNARSTFAAGESVQFFPTLENIRPYEQSLTFHDAQIFDIIVRSRRDQSIVWQWSSHMAYALAITTVTLQPNEIFRQDWEWHQTDDAGNPVPAGIYDATAYVCQGDLENVALQFRSMPAGLEIR